MLSSRMKTIKYRYIESPFSLLHEQRKIKPKLVHAVFRLCAGNCNQRDK